MTKFSQNAVWADTLQLTRAHWVALVAIAGVFNFLPVLLVNHFLPMPDTADMRDFLRVFLEYVRENRLWLLLQSFVIMIGSATMLRLVFARNVTVGGAIWFAVMLLPAYSILLALVGLAVGAGLMLLLIPGLYLWGRMVPAGAVMVAEDRRGPIDALKRSFAITGGHGWEVLALYVLVWLPGLVLVAVLSQVSGILFILLAGQHLGKLLAGIVLALLGAALATLLTMLSAAIYRALAAPEAAGPDLAKAG